MSSTEKIPSVKTTVNAGHLTNVFEALKDVRDEGKVKFTEDGIFAKVNDPSNTMMAVCKLSSSALNGIKIKNGDDVLLASRYEKMHGALSTFKKSTELQVEYPHKSQGSHAVRLFSPDEGMEYKENVLDESTVADMPQTKPLSQKRRIVVDGSDLKKAISNAERYVSDEENSIEMGTDEDIFYVKSTDKIDGSFEKEFYQSGPSDDGGLGDVESSIGYPKLEDIKGVIGSSNNVTVHVADSKPVRFDVDLDESGEAQIIYIIAPRIES